MSMRFLALFLIACGPKTVSSPNVSCDNAPVLPAQLIPISENYDRWDTFGLVRRSCDWKVGFDGIERAEVGGRHEISLRAIENGTLVEPNAVLSGRDRIPIAMVPGNAAAVWPWVIFRSYSDPSNFQAAQFGTEPIGVAVLPDRALLSAASAWYTGGTPKGIVGWLGHKSETGKEEGRTVFTITSNGQAKVHVAERHLEPIDDKFVISVATSQFGSSGVYFRTDKKTVTMNAAWFDAAGQLRAQAKQTLGPRVLGDGVMALRNDGTLYGVVGIGDNMWTRTMLVGIDRDGATPLRPQPLPFEGKIRRDDVSMVECGDSVWVLVNQYDAGTHTESVTSVRIGPNNDVSPPKQLWAIRYNDSWPRPDRTQTHAPMHVGCGGDRGAAVYALPFGAYGTSAKRAVGLAFMEWDAR
jgi:hypothetical protein